MDRQKFTKMMDLSERMYLRTKEKHENHMLTTLTVNLCCYYARFMTSNLWDPFIKSMYLFFSLH